MTLYEPTSSADLRQHYAAVRKRLTRAPVPVKVEAEPAPEPERPIRVIMVERVIGAACKHFKIVRGELMTRSRNHKAVHRRFSTLFIVRELCPASLGRVGVIFKLDHSSILNAVRKALDRIDTDPLMRSDIQAIRALVLNPPKSPQVCPCCKQEIAEAMS